MVSSPPAYVELPDGKVLSGTEWGNLLLWDGGFIKVEISRKNMKFCHQVGLSPTPATSTGVVNFLVAGYDRSSVPG